MPYLLLGGEPPRDYESFMLETLEVMRGCKVSGIAIVVMADTEELTAYHNMSLNDKILAAEQIRFDATDDFILANIGRYREAAETWEPEAED